MSIDTWPDARDAFLKDRKRRGCTPKTIAVYLQRLPTFLDWATARGVTIASFEYQHGEDYYDHVLALKGRRHGRAYGQDLAAWSHYGLINATRAFLNWCFEARPNAPRPNHQHLLKALKPRSPRALPKPLAEAEVLALWQAVERHTDLVRPWTAARNQALLALMLDTGVRSGEATGLRVEDLMLDATPAFIRLDGKTGPRLAPLSDACARRVALWLTERARLGLPHDRAFVNNVGGPFNQNSLLIWLYRLCKAAGIPRRHPHQLRHTMATALVANGQMMQAQLLGGWQSGEMLQRYVGLSVSQAADAQARYSPLATALAVNAPPAPGPRPIPQPEPIVAQSIPARANLGEANGRSKLSRRQVAEIKRLLLDGVSKSEIARTVVGADGQPLVTRQIIIKIAAGAIWTDVEAAPVLLAAD